MIDAKEIMATVEVTGNVVYPTCNINGLKDIPSGLTQTVDLGQYTAKDILDGTTKSVPIPLVINCSSGPNINGVSLSFSHLGSYPPVGSYPGAIRTNLRNIAVLLKWKIDNSEVEFFNIAKVFKNNGDNIYDASMVAKIVPYTSINNIEKGRLKSGIKVIMSYI